MNERTSVPLEPPPSQPAASPQPFSDEALLLTDAPVPGKAAEAARRAREGELWTRTVADWTELAPLQEECEELARSAAEPNPFYEPWMLLPALRNFGTGQVRVLLVLGPGA